MDTLGRAAPTLRPATAISRAPAQRTTAPQSWMVRVANAGYYWPELITGLAGQTGLPAPVGRYLQRMQSGLDACAAQHQLFLAVTRPRVRFDVTGMVQWGFFSLKLTLPLLLGADQARDHITIELRMPPTATVNKPSVVLSEHFISLNWGGTVEVFSVHDLLRLYGHARQLPSKVVCVGRMPDVLRTRAADGYDTLLLALGVEVEVNCAEGDPAAHAGDADALHAERADMIEAALIRYFEGSTPRHRSSEERQARSARLLAIQAANNLVQYTIDLALPDSGNYQQLCSEFVSAAGRHLLSCFIADGQAQVASMPLPASS